MIREGVDMDRGEAVLVEWANARDLRHMQDSLYTEAKLMVNRYTGGRLSPSELDSAAAKLITILASRFGDEADE